MSGMSKSYAMTGWRIGYVSASQPIMEAIRKLHQYLIMSASTVGQVAALEALTQGEKDVSDMREEYDSRRKLIVSGFNELGLDCFEPHGAFYAFPNVAASGLSDEQFCEQLLYEERVALVPGSAFGAAGAGFVRASYATSKPNIEIALERMRRFMRRHG